MCWRDDIQMTRICSVCSEKYFGDLGHRGCPGWRPSAEEVQRKERILAIGQRHGWDESASREKIKRTEEILCIDEDNAIEFLLECRPNPKQDVIVRLEEDNPPF